jgi:hypothetical protein
LTDLEIIFFDATPGPAVGSGKWLEILRFFGRRDVRIG